MAGASGEVEGVGGEGGWAVAGESDEEGGGREEDGEREEGEGRGTGGGGGEEVMGVETHGDEVVDAWKVLIRTSYIENTFCREDKSLSV